MLNLQKLFDYIQTQNIHSPRLVLALSGGVDSMVLLHLLSQYKLKNNINIKSIYINHNLNINSELWGKCCQKACEDLNIPFESRSIEINLNQSSLEKAARDARYKILAEFIQSSSDILLTGHHSNDQAETVLYRLFRGAGLKGLTGIKFAKKFNHGYLIRPLLDYSQKDILNYAQIFKLKFIEDPSNQNSDFDRNFIRHHILNQIDKRWPHFFKKINHTTDILNQTQWVLEDYLKTDLFKYQNKNKNKNRYILNIKKLILNNQNNIPKIKLLLKYWLEHFIQYTLRSDKLLNQLLIDIQSYIQNPSGKWVFKLGELGELRFFNQNIIYISMQYWEDLKNFKSKFKSKSKSYFSDSDKINIQKIKVYKKSHHTSLKKIFQAHKIPAWLREYIPLVFENGELKSIELSRLNFDFFEFKDVFLG